MADQRDNSAKARLTVRINHETLQQIERLARQRRTNASQIGRTLIEDQLTALGKDAA